MCGPGQAPAAPAAAAPATPPPAAATVTLCARSPPTPAGSSTCKPWLDGSIVNGAAVGELLEELERGRERHMRDIVATIQADQYRLITADPSPPLVIQGGPGTGKTAVGLHRASYLLYSNRDTLARRGVLVVGPNRTFMEYVSHVLPALGEGAVEQRAVGELVDGVEATVRDPQPVAELKSDLRLVEVIRRAAELRLRSEPTELVARLEGSFVSVRERELREHLAAARTSSA